MTEKEVGAEFGIFYKNFFVKYPEFNESDVFLTGESYAGHYIPGIARELVFNLHDKRIKGIAIGDGYVDPQR